MKIDTSSLNNWPQKVYQAKEIQNHLRKQVIKQSQFGNINRIAGVDIGLDKQLNQARGAVAILSFPELKVLETKIATQKIPFPYVPGYLSFREIPVILSALKNLELTPDLIICDGQGYAHPRRFGLACHLGVLTDVPTIGAAKSRLIGKYREPDQEKGSWTTLTDKGEVIGSVLRTRSHTKPIFVSIGHRVGLEDARNILLSCCPRYRLPETTRIADKLASAK